MGIKDELQELIKLYFHAARVTHGNNFGTWVYIHYNAGERALGGEATLLDQDGAREPSWIPDSIDDEADDFVFRWAAEANKTDRPWRALLMGGKDDGTFNVIPLYDDSPDMVKYPDRWDPMETDDDLVARALPLLNL